MAICSAEIEHGEREFWRLAHETEVAHTFDRWLVPTCHLGAALPHERKAGEVLNWLSHLQADERLIVQSIAAGLLGTDRPYLRALCRRRLLLKQGFHRLVGEYRTLRCEMSAIPATQPGQFSHSQSPDPAVVALPVAA